MVRVLVVFGTRPEAIKMCPLVHALESSPLFHVGVCATGQHREMLDQVLGIFSVTPDYDLDVMRESQTLEQITSSVLDGIGPVIGDFKPDIVLVHGDTTTSMASALGAFYRQVPVGHVEAGLRTYNRYSPFPEEMNRKMITALASFHFCPTQGNERALARESVTENVFVTGNTVIDSFQYTIRESYRFHSPELAVHDFSQPTILMTAHRRENLGKPLEQICDAVNELTRLHPDLHVVYPLHLNPAVRHVAERKLGPNDRVRLIDPVDVQDMHNAMAKSIMVLTDSGGIQEEAPHLGKPVVVLRTETERPEAVEAGTAVVAGVEAGRIVAIVDRILSDQSAYDTMANAVNPYGDGHASERIVQALAENLARS